MVRAIFSMVLIGFVFLFSRCANYPEPLLCRDTLGISKSLSDVLKKKYGLFVTMNSTISSTDDFFDCTLLLLGDTEGHLDTRIAFLGMKKTQKYLFKEVIFIDSSSDVEVSSPTKDTCVIKNDTVISIDYKLLPRTRNTYGDNTDLNKIFEQSLNSGDCVFVMTKSNSKRFSNRLKELIVK
jgi:hypothetical protein